MTPLENKERVFVPHIAASVINLRLALTSRVCANGFSCRVTAGLSDWMTVLGGDFLFLCFSDTLKKPQGYVFVS